MEALAPGSALGRNVAQRAASAHHLEAYRQVAEAKTKSIKIGLYRSVLQLGDWKVSLFFPPLPPLLPSFSLSLITSKMYLNFRNTEKYKIIYLLVSM